MVSFLQSTNTVPSPQHLLNRCRVLSPLNEDSVKSVTQGIWKKECLHVVSYELLSLCQPHIPSRQAPGQKGHLGVNHMGPSLLSASGEMLDLAEALSSHHLGVRA